MHRRDAAGIGSGGRESSDPFTVDEYVARSRQGTCLGSCDSGAGERWSQGPGLPGDRPRGDEDPGFS
ncbi:hypothetical protein ACFPM0_28595 [Pseudonocardia sulfidoxydans]|uniref:hypothetical protein n=1 Tax=Pseudonocardia sulfidoxydans TaxID=54011 RepID=UPI00360ABBD0